MKPPMSQDLRELQSRVVLMLLIVAEEDSEATEVEAEVEIDPKERVEMMRRKMMMMARRDPRDVVEEDSGNIVPDT